MKYLQAQKVVAGSVIRTKIALKLAGKKEVPAGCQGVVDEVTRQVRGGCFCFNTTWRLSDGSKVSLPIKSPSADLVEEIPCRSV